MSDEELDAYNDWLNSRQVVNQVVHDRTAAGQSMLDVADDAERCS